MAGRNQPQRQQRGAPVATEGSLPVLATERGLSAAQWNALKTSIFPGAADESVALAVDYCTARKLDPLQKPVHIVPMWVDGGMRDVVMPGIGLYRIQAQRSGSLAGMGEPEFGPTITEEFTTKDGDKVSVRYPEYCNQTIAKQMPNGTIVEFRATVFWREEYATESRNSEAPNAMWRKRPFGQLAKCAEAQALRRGWPEIDQGPTAEEMAGKAFDAAEDDRVVSTQRSAPRQPSERSATQDFLGRHAQQEEEPEPRMIDTGIDPDVAGNVNLRKTDDEPDDEEVIEQFALAIKEADVDVAKLQAIGNQIAGENLSDSAKADLRVALKAALAKARRSKQSSQEPEAVDPDAAAKVVQTTLVKLELCESKHDVVAIMKQVTPQLRNAPDHMDELSKAADKRLEALS